jgi:hypothetical protein
VFSEIGCYCCVYKNKDKKQPFIATKGFLLYIREICLQHVSVPPKRLVNKSTVYIIKESLDATDGLFIFVVKVFD